MQSEKVHLTKEKETLLVTLLVTLYLRALDSRSKNPILHDKAAEDAVSRIDYNFRNWCDAVCRIAVSTIRNKRARATCSTSSKFPSFA